MSAGTVTRLATATAHEADSGLGAPRACEIQSHGKQYKDDRIVRESQVLRGHTARTPATVTSVPLLLNFHTLSSSYTGM